VAGQRRDGLSIERPAALAAAEHAADHLDLAAAALPMHHPIVDHVPDEATAHQAGEIRLKPAIPASERRRLRLRSNGSRFHSNPPHVTPGCPDPRHDVLHANRRFGRSTTLSNGGRASCHERDTLLDPIAPVERSETLARDRPRRRGLARCAGRTTVAFCGRARRVGDYQGMFWAMPGRSGPPCPARHRRRRVFSRPFRLWYAHLR